MQCPIAVARARACSFPTMTAIAMVVAVLSMPAAAAASQYNWKVDADGVWTNPNNWFHQSGPVGPGYPNAPGDVAAFTALYTGSRRITIPANVTITVGAITFGSSFGIQIVGAGTFSRLVLDNGTAPAEVIRPVPSSQIDILAIPVFIQSPLSVTVPQGSRTYFTRFIAEASGIYGITKKGPGEMDLEDGNPYSGPTTIADGLLILRSAQGASIRGELVIGDGEGARGTARVRVNTPGQILDPVRVRVNADGQFVTAAQERIGDLIVNQGEVISVSSASSLTMGNLTMTGGVLDSQTDGRFVLEGNVTAVSSPSGGAALLRLGNGGGTFSLPDSPRVFTVNDGPGLVDLEITLPVAGTGSAGLIKEGLGTLRFAGAHSNTYPGATVVRRGRLELARESSAIAVPGRLEIAGTDRDPATVELMAGVPNRHNIADTSVIDVGTGGALIGNSDEVIGSLTIRSGGRVLIGSTARAGWMASGLSMAGGRLALLENTFLTLNSDLVATSSATEPAVIDGDGGIGFRGNRQLLTDDGPQPIDVRLDVPVSVAIPLGGSGPGRLTKRGAGVVRFGANNNNLVETMVVEGTVVVTARHATSPLTLTGGRLGGTGTVGPITASTGTIAPGLSPGRLVSGSVALATGTTFAVELNGTTPGSGYDQLAVVGSVNLGNARLAVTPGFTLPPRASFTIVDNDGADPVIGTFAGLAEGATLSIGGQELTISYRGGDGNDVVLSTAGPVTYYLAEGATGPFFDSDVLIANPNDAEAPVTLTFLKEGGRTVVEQRVVPAQSSVTVHVDQIAGLEAAAASVRVTSDKRLPLVVERTMFWDASYYGGHTANAVAQPETRWIFAEGFQGFFDTYILIANANAEPATATLTFLREGDTPFVTTVPVEAFARKTVYAGDYPEVVGRAFGIVVEATRPVIAERSMYFASLPGRLWSGGHVNTGIVAPATSWFHAEGATGGFFNTFILLSNPQDSAAHVELRFLLDNGEVITRQKTLGARQRLTVNPATEGDARLENAAVSTVVQSDVPIVSERSMYWPGEATPFGEGHNSTGVVSPATRWGLAEGRIGGPRQFDTFILLANPSTTEAHVTITYLRENGAPIVKTYTVPPTSRFNVDASGVPELQDASFGARIDVTNGVPIAVERSMYWNANGVFWAGGTNALGTPLP